MIDYSYVLIDEKTRQIKKDCKTGCLCIFDSEFDANKVKRSYASSGGVKIIKCEMYFTNKKALA